VIPNSDNVFPLRPDLGIADGELPLPVEDLTEAVSAIGHCLGQIKPDTPPGWGFGNTRVTTALLHLAGVERQLEDLAGITVASWPDVRWALHFCNARVRALNRIRKTMGSVQAARGHGHRPPAYREDVALVEFVATSHALREVRDLIVERYPQTRQAS
jgi:hypothetical protein